LSPAHPSEVVQGPHGVAIITRIISQSTPGRVEYVVARGVSKVATCPNKGIARAVAALFVGTDR
jgi:hypothetical protein